ncbi:hypothetical protein KAFR_0A01120 [Kazachstania africana CBS 2517]|uniref:Amino acid permease/ SLC12A domain-containing protein n=1 Tax=Kazachstania africana (strain ATCC 22294 / BCRC 22015 / CBS 2517 / CECT 1963 / NBRC 1671 / NRRL Y-8276) TaxID=1071382 RepID=H2AMF1_KAZAF|nr:hypothetical protein KAFR_0A01120 [Kazachstania africana CBS 2517]CCF55551.1 hypothetical protein KAFR_0A01120 [Kazachstania africana CBS 2517]
MQGKSSNDEFVLTEVSSSPKTTPQHSKSSYEPASRQDSTMIHRFVNSFKRAEQPPLKQDSDLEEDTDTIVTDTQLKKTMKSRHVVMMSLGTGIGTGLLVANAQGLHKAGPAPLVIAYGMVSFVTYFMIQAAGEMAVVYPTLPGNFNAYISTFISKPFGFATVWLFFIQWLTVLPLELITAAMTVQYWNDSINADVYVVIFYVFLLFIHFFGVKAYGETEFIFNLCKILFVGGFIIFSIVVNVGGAGNSGYIGAKYWHDPGAFTSDTNAGRFKGVCYVLVTAYFSYGGMELFALSVNEQENPRRSTPTAAKQSIYRIVVIYLLTMILVGFNVPSNSNELMGSGGSVTHASPYVLAASIHGVKVVPHIVNAVILISLISVGNSALYAAPRLMCALAQQGFAPKFMDYVDREGRPLFALIVCSVFGVIGFVACSSKEEQVFNWLAAIAGLAELFTWSGIMISHIRFRQAMKLQNKSLDEVGYKSPFGVYGSYFGVFFNLLVFVAQFWVALAPPMYTEMSADTFFESYLAFPIFFAFYFGYMIWKRDFTLFSDLESVDLDYHRRIYDPELVKQEDEEKKEMLKNSPMWKRMYYFWC